MRRRACVLAGLAVAAPIAIAVADSGDAQRDWRARQIDTQGIVRTRLEFDGAPRQRIRGIVVLLHGNGGSAAQLVDDDTRPQPYREWKRIARREALRLIVPDGVVGPDGRRGWNDCRADASTNPDSDDVGYLESLIATARAELGLGLPAFVVGTSNGGHMALRMAIERPASVRAVAAIAAAMPAVSECPPPTAAVDVLIMNGTADRILPWQGGAVAAGGTPRGSVLSAEQSARIWAALASARGEPDLKVLRDRDRTDGGRPVRLRYRGALARVELWRIEGGGHVEPSIAQRLPPAARQNGDVEMADAVWRFFSASR